MQLVPYKAADHPWDWSIPVPFQQGWRVGDLLFIGGQVSADRDGNVLGPGDIAVQTRNVFEAIKKVVEDAGGTLADLVKLNTYYVFDGPDEEQKGFWEDFTRVRLEYLSDPGPAATAVRVAGLAYADLVVEIEGIAVLRDS
ncbi:MAG: 2-iminobutanoate/2-iminopropanoate deaminase [Solirubrobacteraceae bacterium]|jgi:2-iminobutanoate/2-iminopropanoate deaminase|nr:2-iminobutanoate/2-iminopropanoate deaminase [Solirubrobacteraceae bacterium]